jgi:hypothetical protein
MPEGGLSTQQPRVLALLTSELTGINAMRIWLKFYGPMRSYVAHQHESGPIAVELEEGAAVSEAVRQLGVSDDVEWASVIGDRIVPGTYVPHSEELITILPPLAGG